MRIVSNGIEITNPTQFDVYIDEAGETCESITFNLHGGRLEVLPGDGHSINVVGHGKAGITLGRVEATESPLQMPRVFKACVVPEQGEMRP